MDVILRLLGFPGVFVGFGEGVWRDQQDRPYEKLEDASKDLEKRRSFIMPCLAQEPFALAGRREFWKLRLTT